jgi:hypothetical protein
MDLSFELVTGPRTIFETLPHFLVVVERLNDLADEGGVVDVLSLPEGDLQVALEVFVLYHRQSKFVDV